MKKCAACPELFTTETSPSLYLCSACHWKLPAPTRAADVNRTVGLKHYGSFHLWGDVPALMPMTSTRFHKIESPHLHLGDPRSELGAVARTRYEERRTKNNGGSWFNVAHNATNPTSISRRSSSKSNARKAASAMIAKIPLPLSRHIAKVYFPRE